MTPGRFKEIRGVLGYTQAELAAVLHVHPLTVSKWERGDRDIPGPVEVLMARLLEERRVKRKKR